MTKIKINVLQKGDELLFANENLIGIRRKNNDIELLRIEWDENNFPRVTTETIITISYGKNTVEVIKDDTCLITF